MPLICRIVLAPVAFSIQFQIGLGVLDLVKMISVVITFSDSYFLCHLISSAGKPLHLARWWIYSAILINLCSVPLIQKYKTDSTWI